MTTEAAAGPAACAVCTSTRPRATLYRLRAFDVVRCPDCGALQRDPLPSPEEMESYYSDPTYITGGYFEAGGREGPEAEIYREALALLSSRRRERGLDAAGRVLDVGAGAGTFLELAREAGWEATGIELSPELAERARARSGAHVVQGDVLTATLEQSAFDAITMWDVLEHTTDPGAVLDRARSLLAPGGVLVVFTIDSASLFNVVADVAWRTTLGRLASPLELLYDKRHNHYFTAKTLATLLSRHGFRIERSQTHRAHLGRWLSEPASPVVLAGAEVIDLLSVPLRRPYRQLLYCVER
jgi:2-polyprenyl-3-methyl-5-hydroxy-6-metoxy-1,4-benzoquinol methylase